jgi:N-acetylglutamate synthase-like GNAT family acetyltransferase
MAQEFDGRGWKMVQQSLARRRGHDVTLIVKEGRDRVALLSRHSHPPGFVTTAAQATPIVGDFTSNVEAELKAETGLRLRLEKFLLHITLDIRHSDDLTAWDTYVFTASCPEPASVLSQTKELVWVSPTQIENLGEKLLASEQGGLQYRGRLNNSIRWALENDLALREVNDKDRSMVEGNLKRSRLEPPDFDKTKWWVAEIHGFFAGNVGLTPHADCLELTGLAVDPIFRGRGVGNALVEYALSWTLLPEKRRQLAERFRKPIANQLWLVTDLPGYFLPTGFTMVGDHEVPAGLRTKTGDLKAAMKFPNQS